MTNLARRRAMEALKRQRATLPAGPLEGGRPFPICVSRVAWRMLRASLCVASVFLVSACSLEPEFAPNAGVHGYGCYTAPGSSDFVVEFSSTTATLVEQDRRVTMQFVPTVWPRFEDRYEGHGYVLTLDSEAMLKMPNGNTRGPCTD